ncbi:MAG TPA: Trp biosynthesis-associated membrane protein [Streptosporangiaceae bacterium]|nr:Trp biosynthesis-associated membrane protein [Streptosporangiaceae bacterium]
MTVTRDQVAATVTRTRSRREYGITLAAGAAGAAIVLIAARQTWAHVLTAEPRPLRSAVTAVRGQDLVPAAGALGLAALAGLAAVIATRRLTRQIVGGLLALFGAGIAAAVAAPLTPADVRSAAQGTGAAVRAGQLGPGGTISGSGGAAGASPGASGLTLAAGHVSMTAFPWRWAVLLGGLVVVAAGLLTLWRGATWPVMSGRYEREPAAAPQSSIHGDSIAAATTGVAASSPVTSGDASSAAPGSPAASPAPGPADPAEFWELLSQGRDPTEPQPRELR